LRDLLSSNIPSVVKKSSQALMALSIDVEAKVPIMEKCGPKLLELLKNSDMDVAENARAAILNAAEDPAGSEIVIAALSETEREFFLGPLNAFAK
ncbi:unnamed protein product, partial [Ostreobium quekettii]